LDAQLAAADLLVAIEPGAQRLLGVVQVQGDDPPPAGHANRAGHRVPVAAGRPDVVAGREEMAGVQTDAHAVSIGDRPEHRGQLLEAAADAGPAARGVLQHDAHAIAAAALVQHVHGARDPADDVLPAPAAHRPG